MRKILYASAAIAFLGVTAAHAGERQVLGATAGATTGAVAGAVVGGPVGAAVGGVAGMAIGAATSVPADVRTYVVEHPVNSIAVEGTLSTDYALPDTVVIHEIPNHPRYGYVYVQDRPVIVRKKTRKVVYASAGERDARHQTGAIRVHPPKRVITYVERHQVAPVEIEGDVRTGYVIPESVELTPVPDNPRYEYVYVQDRPVLVDAHTRQVIWVR
ncbi:MAG: DUF1236 domain-containing protein [Rhizobiaceae bacterium]|jgi:hypothetical protein